MIINIQFEILFKNNERSYRPIISFFTSLSGSDISLNMCLVFSPLVLKFTHSFRYPEKRLDHSWQQSPRATHATTKREAQIYWRIDDYLSTNFKILGRYNWMERCKGCFDSLSTKIVGFVVVIGIVISWVVCIIRNVILILKKLQNKFFDL